MGHVLSINFETLTIAQLDAMIADLAARQPVAPILSTDLIQARSEKLTRAYRIALNQRIAADPLLANTTTVEVS